MKYENINIEIIRSKRKTIAIEITKELCVFVRAPFSMLDSDIKRFVNEKSSWLEKHLTVMKEKIKMLEQQEDNTTKLTAEEIRQLAEQALVVIPERVAFYAKVVGVTVGKISIRNQISRWGSCSSKGNLNFNCLLILMPSDVIDYVVVHELCHRKEMNHSTKYWAEVAQVLLNYKVQKKWLKDNGNAIMRKMI
jgi:predicted metal-dependent hydrolase